MIHQRVKRNIYLVLMVIALVTCRGNLSEDKDTISLDTLHSGSIRPVSPSDKTSDTLVRIITDSLFTNLELEPRDISEQDFEAYRKNYKVSCALEPGGFIKGLGISVLRNCEEICETYLVEIKSGKKMLLPSSYDQGIGEILFSPSCRQFIIYGSYDGPDYDNYYEYRSEIIGFTLIKDVGLMAIEPSFKSYSKDWSIEDVTWINENSIAIKVYEGQRGGDVSSLQFKYLEIKLSQ